jgi:hypothetical protein
MLLVSFLFLFGCNLEEPICADGVCEALEINESSPFYCPEDCGDETKSGDQEIEIVIEVKNSDNGEFIDVSKGILLELRLCETENDCSALNYFSLEENPFIINEENLNPLLIEQMQGKLIKAKAMANDYEDSNIKEFSVENKSQIIEFVLNPKIIGEPVCGEEVDSCEEGEVISKQDSGDKYLWECKTKDKGINCEKEKTSGGGTRNHGSRGTIVCKKDDDCGTETELGDAFCIENNVVQKFIVYSCENAGKTSSECLNDEEERIIEECLSEYVCVNGDCVEKNNNLEGFDGQDGASNQGTASEQTKPISGEEASGADETSQEKNLLVSQKNEDFISQLLKQSLESPLTIPLVLIIILVLVFAFGIIFYKKKKKKPKNIFENKEVPTVNKSEKTMKELEEALDDN